MRLIDADYLKELITDYPVWNKFDKNRAIEMIDNAQTIEPSFGLFRVMLCENCQAYATNKAIARLAKEYTTSPAKWIKIFENPYVNGYVCSCCGHKIQVTEQFLPEVTECDGCGAEMKGVIE